MTQLLGVEFALVVVTDLLTRATTLVDSVLSELHSNTVSIELMQHAAALDLKHFESSDYQDRLERARRVAGSGSAMLPQLLGQGQDIITVHFAGGRPRHLLALADPAAAGFAGPGVHRRVAVQRRALLDDVVAESPSGAS